MNTIAWNEEELPDNAGVIIRAIEKKQKEFYQANQRHAEYIIFHKGWEGKIREIFNSVPVCTEYSEPKNELMGMKIIWADLEDLMWGVHRESRESIRNILPPTAVATRLLQETHRKLMNHGDDFFKIHQKYMKTGELSQLKNKLVAYDQAIYEMNRQRKIIENLIILITKQNENNDES